MADAYAALIPKAAAPTPAAPKPAPAADPYAALVPASKPAVSTPPPKPAVDPYAALVPSKTAAPAKTGIVDKAVKYAGEEFQRGIVDPIKKVGADISQGVADTKKRVQDKSDPMGVKSYGDVAKIAGDAFNVATSPASTAAHALAQRPYGAAMDKVTGGRYPAKQAEEDMGTALLAARPAAGAAPKIPNVGKPFADMLSEVKKFAAPSTVSSEAGQTAAAVRRTRGRGQLMADQAAHSLLTHYSAVANAPPAAKAGMVTYIENRGTPKGIMAMPSDPKLKAAADAASDVYNRYKKFAEYALTPEQRPNFIENYYQHLWKDPPNVVQQKLNGVQGVPMPRQGSARNTRARSIPTIEEGLARGLTPAYDNPLDMTMNYAQNMSRFVSTNDLQNQLRTAGMMKYHAPGTQPDGWVPVQGMNARKEGATILNDKGKPVARRPEKLLYAPEDAARVYNNYISKGLEGTQAGPFFTKLREGANGLAMLKFGLSAFHATTMAKEAMVSELAQGFGAASRVPGKLAKGDFKGAGQEALAAGKSTLKFPAAPVLSYMKGGDFQKKLLSAGSPDAITDPVQKAFYQSGNQLKMDDFYRLRGAGSFFQSAHRGTLGKDVKEAVGKITQGTIPERLKGGLDMFTNVLQAGSAPLFEHVIPRLKQGAWSSTMEDWMRANPNASPKDTEAMARKLTDTMDNRFGELIQDNLFWHRWTKQLAQLALISPGWNIGTVREIAGGLGVDLAKSAKGLATGEGVTPRTAYVLGLAAFVPLQNTIYQKLKTGQWPSEPLDLLSPKTGGTTTETTGPKQVKTLPERAAIPGYEKDVFGVASPEGAAGELKNKRGFMVSAIGDLAANKDYKDQPVYRPFGVPRGTDDGSRFEDVAQYVADALLPISTNQLKQKEGSNISPIEAAAGFRPATRFMQDPDQARESHAHFAGEDWKRKKAGDKKRAAKLKKPVQKNGKNEHVGSDVHSEDPYAALVPSKTDDPYAALVPK